MRGTKADMIKRLDEHDVSGTWRQEIKYLGTDDGTIAEGFGEQDDARWRERETGQEDEEEDAREDERVSRPISTRIGDIGAEGNCGTNITDRPQRLSEEHLFTRRERELLQRELELTRRERDMAIRMNVEVSTNNNNLRASLQQPISAISQLVSEFFGERDAFGRWEKQFNLIRATYAIDDSAARVVLGLKLKERALRWFHSKSENLEIPVDRLLEQMRELFDGRSAKIELRREFEKREWKNDESFSAYFYDKVILAERAPVREDENGSVIEVKGIVKLRITDEGVKAEDATLRVVKDNTMKHGCLLGRDILRILRLGLFKLAVEEKSATEKEILNIEPVIFDGAEIDKIDINANMSSEVKKRVREKIRTVYVEAEKPRIPNIKAELHLDIKSQQPFHFTPTRLSYDEKTKLREIIDDLETRGIICPSNSEYASRIVLVKKRNGNLRMCIDYRSLNKITSRDNYPLPIIEEQIDALQGKRYFTLFDLKDGFHHVYMVEDSIKYTSFITPFGQYKYRKMPFGLKNAPARFQRFVHEVLSDVIKTGNVVAYIDDFLVATDTIEEHLETLDKVFRLLMNNLLELRLDKCHFLYEEIGF